MHISIQGQDFTSALDTARPLTIERKLNEPSVCQLWLSLPAGSAIPARNQSLVITGDDGNIYFTGYLASTPMPEFAGLALRGPRFRIVLQAVSDEVLLDQVLMPSTKAATGQTAAALMTSLVTHTGSAALATNSLTLPSPVGNFVTVPGASFSTSAGRLATQVRAAYRAQSGALTLVAIPSVVHPLSETDGTLALAALTLNSSLKRALANDITVCGEHEPAAYVTEYFLGDGASTQFDLAAEPFFPPASQSNLIAELFNKPALDLTLWGNPTGSSYFSLGAAGLNMQGGNGIDGETVLTWVDPIEMGGTLLLEASGVTLAAASTGILAAFFSGLSTVTGCVAGFQATAQQGTGDVTLQPIVFGCASGATFALNPAHQYTLRIRTHCPEQQRERAMYYSCGDAGLVSCGGQLIPAAAKLQFEIQEFVNGVASMPVVLYDGSVSSLPVACSVVAASSLNLSGTLRALRLSGLGSGWVVSTPANGAPYTRRVGAIAESAECRFERAGKLVFYTGFAPAVGEQIAASYRTISRAVGRAVNAASQQQNASSSWVGSVTQPAARSSADCRHAASALVQAASSAGALWSGACKSTRFSFAADVWPGDALQLSVPSAALDAQVAVRSVKLTYRSTVPDLVEYEIAFANDWAEDLAIQTSAAVPADTWLPAPIAPAYPASLTALTVTALTGGTVTIDTGAAPPAGGGFEIRRRDFVFMPGEDPDLVMRGSQQAITFSRQAANDRFYIRMYDAATPPNYSEFSAALFINLPFGT